MIATFDVETTTKNKGNPFTASNKLVSYSLKCNDDSPRFSYYTDINFLTDAIKIFPTLKLLIGFNIKFDLHWARKVGVCVPDKCRIWDCQIAEFIITGQKGSYPSLNECLAKYGFSLKDDKIAEYWSLGIDTIDIPVEELKHYNNEDVSLTYQLYLRQQEVMSDEQKRLCLVMGADLLVLQEMEYNGVLLNVDLCKEKANETAEKLKEINEELLIYAPTPDINLDSGYHLSALLFGGAFAIDYPETVKAIYKSGEKKGTEYEKTIHNFKVFPCPQFFKPLKGSETKLKSVVAGVEYTIYQTSEDVLKQLKTPTKNHKRIIELLLERAELAKLMDTYYGKLPELLDKMEWGAYLHGQYNQCVAATGRLSSSNPNMQNFSGAVDKLLISRYPS